MYFTSEHSSKPSYIFVFFFLDHTTIQCRPSLPYSEQQMIPWLIRFPTILYPGHGVVQLVEALRYKDGRSQVRFPMASMEFFIDTTLLLHYGHVAESASNRNKYQKYTLGVKADGA